MERKEDLYMKPVYRQKGETIDHLIMRFKREYRRAGISESIKRHSCYVKPGEARRQKHKAAIKKQKKQAARFWREKKARN